MVGRVPAVSDNPAPFRLLTHEEFSKLSTEEKYAYLAKAVEKLVGDRVPVFDGLPPKLETSRQ
jgi:hypothetical protein